MRLKRNIFWRVMILLAFSIVISNILVSLLALKEYRRNAKEVYTTNAVFLAERAERMVLWDDRVALLNMLVSVVRETSVLEYAFAEHQGKPYVHTFQVGVPRKLLNLHGDRLESPIVSELEDGKGYVIYDIAVPIGDDFAILHVGLSRNAVDQNICEGIVAIGGIAAAMILLGSFFAVIIAKFTTKEVDRLTRSLQQSRDELEFRVEERTEELRVEITERKQAERALRETLEKRKELEHIINNSPAVVFLWRATEAWPVEFVSDNVQQFGYSPEDFYSGRIPFASIVHSDDLERVANEIAQYSQKGRKRFVQEYRIITKAGETRWLDDRTWVRRNLNGVITHYQGIVLDVTERKRAEEELNKYRDHLEDLVKQRTDELEEKVAELERMNDVFVGREFRIKELKNRIKELEESKDWSSS